MQLNTDRGTKRRKPIKFTRVLEPFDDNLFNFTKVNHGEYLFKLRNESSDLCGKLVLINMFKCIFYVLLYYVYFKYCIPSYIL